MKNIITFKLVVILLSFGYLYADNHKSKTENEVSKKVIEKQRKNLAENTKNKGFGPQSPRDIEKVKGKNRVIFSLSPDLAHMNLCNIHFHKNAEHKGGEFTTYAGNGDGHGYLSGYKYSGTLKKKDLFPTKHEICPSHHGSLFPGDTIEVHYVYSTAKVKPGVSLNACLNDSTKNPQLRVEAQVFVLVNNKKALNFQKLVKFDKKKGFFQALHIPNNTGKPIIYKGSTTGPGFNEKGSPYQVTWSVRPKIAKVNINSVGQWCKGNIFEEDHAHGVRNLILNPFLLSNIK